MRQLYGAFLCALTIACATPALAQEPPRWPSIARFSSESEFYQYLANVRAAERAATRPLSKQDVPDCPPELYPCAPESSGADENSVVVTGSRVASPSPSLSAPATTSITNTQNVGVDEGDIVKLVGRFLIVLQDGRLFAIDTGAGVGQVALVDRADVYRRRNAQVWYDEILVFNNRIVVTGYNYGENATEYSVFSISERGRFTREAVYFLSSNDYYDSENYATRLVNGNLVIYTPLDVSETSASQRLRWPLVRRWLREGDRNAVMSEGARLFEARDIYRPVQATFRPTVHTISVCPLGSSRAGDELECRSTALVGPPAREFYVSTSHIYLWTWDAYYGRAGAAACARRAESEFESGGESALFQIPLRGGAPRAQFVGGHPYDQLSMDAAGATFRALAVWIDPQCERRDAADLPLRFLSTPLSAFNATPGPANPARFTMLPGPGGQALENRFTESYLVYAGRTDWGSYPPAPDSEARLATRLVAAPVANPGAAIVFEAPHSALRVERVGDNAIVAGYRDWRGLSVSLLDLSGSPRIASTVLMEGSYESEGRSHAFNAAIDADGSGLMGLPTVMRRAHAGRWWWRSASSDVSFLSVSTAGRLAPIGALRSVSPRDPSYACEVSCIDWYGNTRAVFIAGRVFGLSGTELMEGVIGPRGVEERVRVNLTAPVRR